MLVINLAFHAGQEEITMCILIQNFSKLHSVKRKYNFSYKIEENRKMHSTRNFNFYATTICAIFSNEISQDKLSTHRIDSLLLMLDRHCS